MAGQQRHLRALMKPLDHPLAYRRLVVDAVFCADLRPDFVIAIRGKRLEVDLVANAPEEGVVRKLIGSQVGGENKYQIEQCSEVLSGGQGEVVDALLHWHSPPVRQYLR